MEKAKPVSSEATYVEKPWIKDSFCKTYSISIIQGRGPPVGHGPHVEKPWYRTLDLKSNPVGSSHFENNFKITINCPATRANMND